MTNSGILNEILAEPIIKIHDHPGDGKTPLPEGTVFNEDGSLYLVSLYGDGEGSAVYRADVDERSIEKIHVDRNGSFASLAFDAAGTLYVADLGMITGEGVIFAMNPDGTDVRRFVDNYNGDKLFPDDLVFDAAGAMYFNDMVGTVINPTGRIFRRAPDGTVTVLVDRLASPNGLSFNPKGDLLWFTEHKANRLLGCKVTPAGEVGGFFPNTGVSTFAHFSGGEADSVTVDAGGNVYVAMLRGGRVEVLDDHGHFLATVTVPGGRGAYPVTTHVAIRPGTRDGFLVAGGTEGAMLFSFPALGEGLPAIRR